MRTSVMSVGIFVTKNSSAGIGKASSSPADSFLLSGAIATVFPALAVTLSASGAVLVNAVLETPKTARDFNGLWSWLYDGG